jgi:drug/metabolite transporter (DMT)-like permease
VCAKVAFLSYGAHPLHVTMARFVLGALAVVPAIVRDRSVFSMNRPRWVLIRAGTNVLAVFFFFFAIRYTTVSKANLLNMSYPLFVFAFAPFVIGERNSVIRYAALVLTLVGAWNVIRPPEISGIGSFASGDLLAFASAITAGFSIASLRRARLHDDSSTIVFYVMIVGLILNAAVLPAIPRPGGDGILWTVAAGACGALGQVLLTVGFKRISASAGAIVSTVRIPIAAVLGVAIFHDPITPRSIAGAVLIVSSLLITAYDRSRERA